jgi:NAD(P)-dependent dehydrogenase (short-subunit alcohol dehydrogenase family)
MKTALVWGANGEIGRAILKKLMEEKWKTLAAGRNPEVIQGLSDLVYEVDLDKDFSVQSAVAAISQDVSQVDLFIYAAGDITSQRIQEQKPQDWLRILDANLNGAFLTTHYSWPLLAPEAHLFFLGAISERMRLPGLAAYAAAKAGLEAFGEVLRKESRRKVSVVRPSAVDTHFWQKVPFKLPPNPLKTDEVAARIYQAYSEGHQGLLDI